MTYLFLQNISVWHFSRHSHFILLSRPLVHKQGVHCARERPNLIEQAVVRSPLLPLPLRPFFCVSAAEGACLALLLVRLDGLGLCRQPRYWLFILVYYIYVTARWRWVFLGSLCATILMWLICQLKEISNKKSWPNFNVS